MFVICGYNFCLDGNCLDATPTAVNNINTVKLTNGIFDHFNMTQDVESPYNPNIPTAWDFLTLMDANFDGSINAGNADLILETLSGFNVKRRKITDFEWIQIAYVPVDSIEDFAFALNDNLVRSLEEYEYALVPVISGVEGNYITNTIFTKFNGVFICDMDTIYRFYSDVEYGDSEQVQKIGVLEPFGQKYPVVISNGLTNYQKGSFSGMVLPNDFSETRKIDRLAIVKSRKELLEFLTNKKAKILKDWNGNSWLIKIVDSPSTSYPSDYGMGIAKVSSNYVEIGDSNKQSDLERSGILKT